MSVISYAQNYEDVMLFRAFADIEAGFYVDVGAQDPVTDSVTMMFYERGWHGINIEPVTHWFERLQAERPRDINVNCAVGERSGAIVLHEFADSGLSTSSEVFARDHVQAGRQMVDRKVPVSTLDEILSQHGLHVIHFLKIDVEGMEKEVLAGLSLARHRPWALVIEATRPNQVTDLSAAWEPLVLGSGYRLVYRDGLNRFYLAEEHMARASAFQVPPNVFDDFVLHREVAANQYANSLERKLEASHDEQQQLKRDMVVVAETALARQRRLDELQAVLEERQAMFEERARAAEQFRTDLLQVTETAKQQHRRLAEIQSVLQERQAALEGKAQEAEKFRVDLVRVTETAGERQRRLEELGSLLQERQAILQAVAVSAENRRLLIEQRDRELWDMRRGLHSALAHGEALRGELERIHSSRSWRLTAPLRQAAQLARTGARHLLRGVATIPMLRATVARLVAARPGLDPALARGPARQRDPRPVHLHRAWRLAAVSQRARRIARRVVGPGLRRAAAVPLLRSIGARLVTGRARVRLLRVAGFVEQENGPGDSEHSQAAGQRHPPGVVPPLTHAGERVYRTLASTNRNGAA